MDETYWGLTGRPFQLTPDPRFWFATATHRKAMSYLGYGLAQGEGFIVITGDVGAGKTTLVAHLVDTLDRQRLDPLRIVSTAIEADDLLRLVAGQLGVEAGAATKAELLVAIERGLHAALRTGRRTLLVVDEAQALPVSALEELRMLSNFQAGGHALLQIVLLGQPEFRDRLHGSKRLEQLRQRVIAIHHLDPMEEHEVADYLAHRLQVVGWQGRPDFAADAFEAFYSGSAGVPRRLNMLAARVMLHAAIERLELIDAGTVRAVLADLHGDLPLTAPEPTVAPSTGEELPVGGPSLGDQEVVSAPLDPAPSPVAAPGWFVFAEVPASAPVSASEEAPTPEPATSDEPTLSERPLADVEESLGTHGGGADLAELTDRVTRLEGRVEEQDAALRRVLTLLVDWVEADERQPATVPSPAPGPAATWNDAA